MTCRCAVHVAPRGWPGTGRRWYPVEDVREAATPIDTDQNIGRAFNRTGPLMDKRDRELAGLA